MSFTSFGFVVFLICTLLVLALVRVLPVKGNKKKRAYLLVIFAAGIIYIGLADIRYVPCILGLCFVTFIAGRLMSTYTKYKKLVCTSAVILCVLQLGVFKYWNLLPLLPKGIKIFVPLGVSFYTFSCISYIVDVYRGKYDAWKSVFDFCCYITFFPKLVSGPIVRADKFRSFLDDNECITSERFITGAQIILLGMFKKMVLADRLALFVDDVYAAPTAFSTATIWLATISYSLQIYFDFSGYSDIAIGICKIVGLVTGRNFDLPYISTNPTEFWKRWHISLSSWLMDYLYIPLGGNRKGKIRTYINLMLTMLIGGLWHGANITFIMWGAVNGAALVVHKVFASWRAKRITSREACGNLADKARKTISVLFTLVFVNFSWIFFRAESLSKAKEIIAGMLSLKGGIYQPFSWTFFAVTFVAIEVIASVVIGRKRRTTEAETKIHHEYCILDVNNIWQLALLFVAIGVTVIMAYVGDIAFIYGAF